MIPAVRGRWDTCSLCPAPAAKVLLCAVSVGAPLATPRVLPPFPLSFKQTDPACARLIAGRIGRGAGRGAGSVEPTGGSLVSPHADGVGRNVAGAGGLVSGAAGGDQHEQYQDATEDEGGDGGAEQASLSLKGWAALALLLEAAAGMYLPLLLQRLRSPQWWLSLLNCFSGGIFLAAGIIHLLPHCAEAQEALGPIGPHGDYPLYLVLVVVGYCVVFYVERVLFDVHGEGHTHCQHSNVFSHSSYYQAISHRAYRPPRLPAPDPGAKGSCGGCGGSLPGPTHHHQHDDSHLSHNHPHPHHQQQPPGAGSYGGHDGHGGLPCGSPVGAVSVIALPAPPHSPHAHTDGHGHGHKHGHSNGHEHGHAHAQAHQHRRRSGARVLSTDGDASSAPASPKLGAAVCSASSELLVAPPPGCGSGGGGPRHSHDGGAGDVGCGDGDGDDESCHSVHTPRAVCVCVEEEVEAEARQRRQARASMHSNHDDDLPHAHGPHGPADNPGPVHSRGHGCSLLGRGHGHEHGGGGSSSHLLSPLLGPAPDSLPPQPCARPRAQHLPAYSGADVHAHAHAVDGGSSCSGGGGGGGGSGEAGFRAPARPSHLAPHTHAHHHHHHHGHHHHHHHPHHGSAAVDADPRDGGVQHVIKPRFRFMHGVVLLVALALHTALECIALGLIDSRPQFLLLFAAIASHKAVSALALSSRFLKEGASMAQVTAYVGPFCLVAPLSILAGVYVGRVAPIARLVFSCFATGTFLYVGASEVIMEEFEGEMRADRRDISTRAARYLKFAAVLAAVALVAASGLLPDPDHR